MEFLKFETDSFHHPIKESKHFFPQYFLQEQMCTSVYLLAKFQEYLTSSIVQKIHSMSQFCIQYLEFPNLRGDSSQHLVKGNKYFFLHYLLEHQISIYLFLGWVIWVPDTSKDSFNQSNLGFKMHICSRSKYWEKKRSPPFMRCWKNTAPSFRNSKC